MSEPFFVPSQAGKIRSNVQTMIPEWSSFTGFVDGKHIVPQPPQFFGGGERNVFVRVEARHRLSGLVLADLLLDLVSVHTVIGPGVC